MSELPETAKAESIIKNWLTAIVDTASERDHSAHMDLISKKVNLVGVPGFDSIGFDDWSNQCQHEFEIELISDIQYQGLKVRAATDSRIMFITHETIIASDDTKKQQGVECLLELEDDGIWRLTQQRIMSDEETAHYLS
jgi:hypothetical protein